MALFWYYFPKKASCQNALTDADFIELEPSEVSSTPTLDDWRVSSATEAVCLLSLVGDADDILKISVKPCRQLDSEGGGEGEGERKQGSRTWARSADLIQRWIYKRIGCWGSTKDRKGRHGTTESRPKQPNALMHQLHVGPSSDVPEIYFSPPPPARERRHWWGFRHDLP